MALFIKYMPSALGAVEGGANRALSNLQAPTAINVNLLPNGDDVLDLGAASAQWAQVYATNLTVGPGLITSEGGYLPFEIRSTTDMGIGGTAGGGVFLETSNAAGGNTGAAFLQSGPASAGGSSGQAQIATGDVTGSGNSGHIWIYAGAVDSGQRGTIYMEGQKIDVNGVSLTNLPTPTLAADATNKTYVDSSVGFSGTVSTAIRYVRKGGSDVTGNGSFSKPFLTIEAAQNSVVTTGLVTFDIGPGAFVESNTFTFRPNSRFLGYGSESIYTSIRRSDNSTIPVTLSGASIVANTFQLENIFITGGGFTVSRPVADPTILPKPQVILKRCQLAGTKTITGAGTGVLSGQKGITISFESVVTVGTVPLILNGVSGGIFTSNIFALTITGVSVDGALTFAGPGNITESFISFLKIDNSLVGSSATTSLFCTVVSSTIAVNSFATIGPSITKGTLNAGFSLTGNIVLGDTKITGLPFVPSNADSPVAGTPNGIPVFGPGIPTGTMLGSSPAAGQVNLVNASGTPVAATASATGSLFWFATGVKLSNGATTTQVQGDAADSFGYLPSKDSRWTGATPPRFVGDALDMLAEYRVSVNGDRMFGPLIVGTGTTDYVPIGQHVTIASAGDETAFLSRAVGSSATVESLWASYGGGSAPVGLYLGTTTNHPLFFFVDDVTKATLDISGNFSVDGDLTAANISTAAEGDLGALTWTAGTDPSGAINKKYRWSQNGKTVSFWVKVDASVPGVAVSALDFALPVDLPAPDTWASQPASTVIAYGSGSISSSAAGSAIGGSDCKLYLDGASIPRVTIETTASVTGTYSWCQISYIAA